MNHLPNIDIQSLNTSEKLDLIAQLWDSFPVSLESVPMPEWHREEIERRLASAETNPNSAIPWDEVRSRLRESD